MGTRPRAGWTWKPRAAGRAELPSHHCCSRRGRRRRARSGAFTSPSGRRRGSLPAWLAVNPDCQGRNVGTTLTDFATDWMRQAGVTLASIRTGGDPGHAPARRTYEKSGYTALPLVRYDKAL
ncbi:GNAT family N-acetyltransferase [Streptomyces katsurahamanus]|uniref:GNAT family N-acetyltransferase n=1 Tax=Streptomyces katsurahamanus TaxID=2577098 RepID=UPI001E510F92|nr:GNAT family N-acetyltransferase [Streptomyces katsurahamanus]